MRNLFLARLGNTAIGNYSVVVGGLSNYAIGDSSVTLGGALNKSHGTVSAILGGGGIPKPEGDALAYQSNIAHGHYSVIVGGAGNLVRSEMNSSYAVIVGGTYNNAIQPYSLVVGGHKNTSAGKFTSILGGKYNSSTGEGSVITGGMLNRLFAPVSIISGGFFNLAGLAPNPYGELQQLITLFYPALHLNISTGVSEGGISLLGGYNNRAYHKLATISGGSNNTIGTLHQQSSYCSFCAQCFNETGGISYWLYYKDPLTEDFVYPDCESCLSDCSTSLEHITGATISGGYSNHLESGGNHQYYYLWLGGKEHFYNGCLEANCQ